MQRLMNGIWVPINLSILTKINGYKILAITIWPFIFIDRDSWLDKTTITHERIHIRQQLELLLVGFWVIYLLEYCYLRLTGKPHGDAYMNISFENEAYCWQFNSNYLNDRKMFAQWRE